MICLIRSFVFGFVKSNLHGGNFSCLFLLMDEQPKMRFFPLLINSHAIENNCYHEHVNFLAQHALFVVLFKSSLGQSIVLVALIIWKACLVNFKEAFMRLWPFLIILHDLHTLTCSVYFSSLINLVIRLLSLLSCNTQ